MASENVVPSWEDFYDGSRIFQFVADATKMPIDQVNFIMAQLGAMALSFFLRTRLSPLSYTPTPSGCPAPYTDHEHRQRVDNRHKFALLSGILLTYFCFGKQVVLAVALGLICYAMLLLLPAVSMHRVTLLVCMTLLSLTHIYRQAMQQAAFVIDITGPLMMMVQRASAVAFSVHDGLTKTKEKMTVMQARNAVTRVPGMLEYFSYVMSFQSILAGPFLMWRDYQDYISGTDEFARAVVLCRSVEQAKLKNAAAATDAPTPEEGAAAPPRVLSPTTVGLRKLGLAAVYALSAVLLAPLFPVSLVTDGSFSQLWFPHKLLLLVVTTTIARHLYYTAWLLAEAVCTMGGLGYSGTDARGNALWDKASNVDIMGVEFGTSFRITMDSWNRKTVVWLRYVAYERLPTTFQVYGTYLLSTMWHGFYPGYYCTFVMAGMLTVSARLSRRSLRPLVVRLQGGEEGAVMTVYHVLTAVLAKLMLSYCTFSFVLLRFWPSIAVYREVYFYLHILGVLGIYLLPVLIPPPQKPKPAPVAQQQHSSNNNNNKLAESGGERVQQASTESTVPEISKDKTV